MDTVTRVMLIEDNPEYRNVIDMALKRTRDMELISSAGTAERALQRLRGAQPDLPPDLILLDLNLPGMSGLDALPLLREAVPDTSILILTQSDNEADVIQAIARGAAGYLLKSATIKQIREGIQTVMTGGASLDPKVAAFLLKAMQSTPVRAELHEQLTEREHEILALLAEGLVKKQIAEKVGISYHTASTHIRHIYEKLQVPNAPAAINKAYRLGLFES